MEEKLQKDKEDKAKKAEEDKLKIPEKEEANEIEEVPSAPEIVAFTENPVNFEEKPLKVPSIYDPNSPSFPSSESKHNIQPTYSTDTHVPYQPEEESQHATNERIITYTPGPIRVPTAEAHEADAENSITVSDLPPIPDTVVEQERLEMIEINNDGTSGHLSHSLP